MTLHQPYTRFHVYLLFLLLRLLPIVHRSSLVMANESPTGEMSPRFWELLARKQFHRTGQLIGHPNRRSKNGIVFLGDGMGMQTISAARFVKSEMRNRLGEANPTLYFECFPFHTMCRTYDLDTIVTDSASSATAYLGGVKTSTGVIGLTGAVGYKSCREYAPEEKVESVLKAARRRGMATGIVTTSRVTHASPAGAFAHIADRDWEFDRKIMLDCPNAQAYPPDIARQLVEENVGINVILGGGSKCFFPEQNGGERADGRNLAAEWLANQTIEGHRAKLITNATQFWKTDFESVDYLFGLLSSSHMPYEVDRSKDDPTLADLTTAAIKILSRHPNGFFLFVEGARIDHAHHDNHAKKALTEMLAFEKAIRDGTRMVNLKETLVIVTADHSHSFSVVGQPRRNESLFDKDPEYSKYTRDGKGMLPLLYSSGPSATVNTARLDISQLNTSQLHSPQFQQPSLVPLYWSTHGGEDVGVYATGIFSHLFHSTVDNTFIALAMKYALCLPPFEEEPHCLACRFEPVLLSFIIALTILHRYYASDWA